MEVNNFCFLANGIEGSRGFRSALVAAVLYSLESSSQSDIRGSVSGEGVRIDGVGCNAEWTSRSISLFRRKILPHLHVSNLM